MKKQDKLELYYNYDDYLDNDQVKEFLDYCERQIEAGDVDDPANYLYEFCDDKWLDCYQQESFSNYFVDKFIEEYPELEEEDIYSALREAMYNCDKFDANMEHFNKEYNFYLLTDPEQTIIINEYPSRDKYRYKFFNSLKYYQWRTEGSNQMQTLYDGAFNYLWICIHYNCSLFEFVKLMQAKKFTVKAWSSVYLFNPYEWSGWVEEELTRDWKLKMDRKHIGFGVDGGRKGPWGYTPDQVYGRVHSYRDKNCIVF